MAFVPPPLPHLVWRRVAHFLSDNLSTLLDLASVNHVLRRICCFHISAFFHTIVNKKEEQLSSDHFYHDLVWMILQGYLDPSVITDFFCINQWNVKPPETTSPGRFTQTAGVRERRRFDRLVEDTVRSSMSIPSEIKSNVYTSFHQGDRDAALAILLPLCTRLKRLEAPVNEGPLCTAVFNHIAKEYKRRRIDPESTRKKAIDAAINDRKNTQQWVNECSDELPFSHLVILSTRASQHGLGTTLIKAIPFMSLPSLERVVLEGVCDRDDFPGWLPDSPRPSAPEIYFQQSSVSKEDVRAFAEGLQGPCEIRQWFEAPVRCWGGGVEFPGSADWDRCLIDANGNVEVRFDFNGGNPGCEYAWVSWLAREKMVDWRRLDEEFQLEEGDDEHDDLSGVLGWY